MIGEGQAGDREREETGVWPTKRVVVVTRADERNLRVSRQWRGSWARRRRRKSLNREEERGGREREGVGENKEGRPCSSKRLNEKVGG